MAAFLSLRGQELPLGIWLNRSASGPKRSRRAVVIFGGKQQETTLRRMQLEHRKSADLNSPDANRVG
jgi:hypothetical protein